MNIPTHASAQQPAIARSATAFDPAHRPEPWAFIAAVSGDGVKADTPGPNLYTGWASKMRFDITINSAGGGPSSTAKGVGFTQEDVPTDEEYMVVVRRGARVGVASIGRFDEFVIPWRPKTAKCKKEPPPGPGNIQTFGNNPAAPGGSGGNTTGTQGGQGSTGSGDSGVGVPP